MRERPERGNGIRNRVKLCFPKDGPALKAHFYGKGSARQVGRLVCLRCGDNSSDHVNKRNARWMLARRRRYMALGRCFQCGRRPLKSVDMCARCYSIRLQRQREARSAAKTGRLCYVCHQRCDSGHSMCEQCRKDRRAYNRELVKVGICPNCRKANDRARSGFVYCTACAEKRAAITRRMYHEGRVRVRGTPRGKQKKWFPKHRPEQTPIAASVYLPPTGSLAVSLAAVPLRQRGNRHDEAQDDTTNPKLYDQSDNTSSSSEDSC